MVLLAIDIIVSLPMTLVNDDFDVAVARLFQQQQLLIKQLVITVILQWL